MIIDIFLTRDQLEDLTIHVLGRKSKEKIVSKCIEKSICGRATAYVALDADTYDGGNRTHRLVGNEAVIYLKDNCNTPFPCAEIQPEPGEP